MGKLSGLEEDVLGLYRRFLRESMRKDRTDRCAIPSEEVLVQEQQQQQQAFLSLLQPDKKENESTSTSFTRQKFRQETGTVKRSDFKTIEFMIRKGEKQLKLMQMPGVTVVGRASNETDEKPIGSE